MKLYKGLALVFIAFPYVFVLTVPSSGEQKQLMLKDGTILSGVIQHELRVQIPKRTERLERPVNFQVKPGEIKAMRGGDLVLKDGSRYTVKFLCDTIHIKTKDDLLIVKTRDIARIDLISMEALDDYDKKTIEEVGTSSFQFMALANMVTCNLSCLSLLYPLFTFCRTIRTLPNRFYCLFKCHFFASTFKLTNIPFSSLKGTYARLKSS